MLTRLNLVFGAAPHLDWSNPQEALCECLYTVAEFTYHRRRAGEFVRLPSGHEGPSHRRSRVHRPVTATALEQAGHKPIILDSLISGPAAYVRNRILYR